MLKNYICRFLHLSSDGIIAKIVLHDLELNFQDQTFKWLFGQVNAGKMQTLLLSSDRKSGIFHQMTPLQMLYIMTLTYVFKVINCEM